MPRSLRTPEHERLCRFLITKRKAAGLTQADVAKELGMEQTHISLIERGQRRVDVIEFLKFARALGFDPAKAMKEIG